MNCGQKLPDEAKFCFRCGSKVCIEGIKKQRMRSLFLSRICRMNLLHYKYGTIIDFSMLQIGVFVRELNRKTQYFIRTADKRKYPDVGIKDCQYYEFEDGELKPIDFEKLKKYQNSEHQVRWMAGSIKYQHENIFS